MKTSEVLIRRLGLPIVRRLPDSILRRSACRYYVEGADTNAIEVMKFFRQRAINPTFDILGESVSDDGLCQKNKEDYKNLIINVSQEAFLYRQSNYGNTPKDYDPQISIKLSMLGLLPGDAGNSFYFTQNLVTEILDEAKDHKIFVRIDMEDSRFTDDTLIMYENLRDKGFENVGIVLQSRLRRTQKDLERLIALEPDIRLVKGAYHNESYDKIFSDCQDVNDAYMDLVCKIISHDIPIEIATMDQELIENSMIFIGSYKRDNNRDPLFCFSMLYGARNDELFRLAKAKIPTRVYIPYGTWERAKTYAFRRFDENPSLVLDIIKNQREDISNKIKEKSLDL